MGMSTITSAVATGANATQVIVAAVAGKSVAIHGYSISNAGTGGGTAVWEDSAGVDISGVMTMGQHVPFNVTPSFTPCMRTPGGLGLSITTAGAANCNGWVVWSQG
jgi:hypothetical protein